MQFADAPGPTNFNQTSELPRDRFKTTTGLDLKTGDHWDVRLEYTGEFADRFNSNTGSVKFTYKF
jgi:outer membrane autotransporter protein